MNVISKRAVANRSEATDGGGGGGKVKEIGGGGGGDSNGGPWSFMYYVNDGVYGSFNCILFDHVTPTVSVLEEVCVCVCLLPLTSDPFTPGGFPVTATELEKCPFLLFLASMTR